MRRCRRASPRADATPADAKKAHAEALETGAGADAAGAAEVGAGAARQPPPQRAALTARIQLRTICLTRRLRPSRPTALVAAAVCAR